MDDISVEPNRVVHEDFVEETLGEISVLEDIGNNGGYYTDCPVCDWISPRENFRGSARLRLFEHFAEEVKAERDGS